MFKYLISAVTIKKDLYLFCVKLFKTSTKPVYLYSPFSIIAIPLLHRLEQKSKENADLKQKLEALETANTALISNLKETRVELDNGTSKSVERVSIRKCLMVSVRLKLF